MLAIAALPGIGPTTVRRLAAQLGGWAALVHASDDRVLQLAQVLGGKRAHATSAHWDDAQRKAEMTRAAVRASGSDIITPVDPRWPQRVERLNREAPLWLFIRGDASVLTAWGVAVIGTREPTVYGRASAQRFGQRVSEAGGTVISGLAYGCDVASHLGCLDVGGRGIAILPGPIDRVVPVGHRDIAERLLGSGGCLVSEYPPDPTADVPAHQFVARDRLQPAMACGLILTESRLGGGSLHAVHAAHRCGVGVACLWRPPVVGVATDPGDAWRTAVSTQANAMLLAGQDPRAGIATPLSTAQDLQEWMAALPR